MRVIMSIFFMKTGVRQTNESLSYPNIYYRTCFLHLNSEGVFAFAFHSVQRNVKQNLCLRALGFAGSLNARRFSGKNGLGSPNLLLLRRSMAYQSGSCFRLMRFSSSSPSFARAEAVEPIWVGEKHEH